MNGVHFFLLLNETIASITDVNLCLFVVSLFSLTWSQKLIPQALCKYETCEAFELNNMMMNCQFARKNPSSDKDICSVVVIEKFVKLLFMHLGSRFKYIKNNLKVKKVIFLLNVQNQYSLSIGWPRSKGPHHAILFSIAWNLGPLFTILLVSIPIFRVKIKRIKFIYKSV